MDDDDDDDGYYVLLTIRVNVTFHIIEVSCGFHKFQFKWVHPRICNLKRRETEI